MIQLTLDKPNVSWKKKSIVFNNQRVKSPENKVSEINFICSLQQAMLKYRRESRYYYKMKLCAKGLFSCPLLNVYSSNFLVLLKIYYVFTVYWKFTSVFQECEKIFLKQMSCSFVNVSLDKAVRGALFWSMNQFKMQTALLLLRLLVV